MADLDLTLVCHYGDKPTPLAQLLGMLVDLLQQRWGTAFEPYSIKQMHATLIGLETELVDGLRVNRWFWKHRGERRVPDPEQLGSVLETTPRLPLRVRFGGFEAQGSYSFTSRGHPPYQRSFQCQGDQVVLMGWPERDGSFPRTLAELRHEFESAQLLHKYHADADDHDNDLFLVLGRIDRSQPLGVHPEAVEVEVREWLARTPTSVAVDREALTLVAYSDPGLPEGRCQCWRPEPAALRAVLGTGVCAL